MSFLILGNNGITKKMVGKMLSETFNMVHLEVESVFRSECDSESDMGEEVKLCFVFYSDEVAE